MTRGFALASLLAAVSFAFPVRFVSLRLQGELVDTGQEVAHFATKTTVVVAG